MRMDTSVCTAESLRCSLETITALLVGHTSIQNKKFKKCWRQLDSWWHVLGDKSSKVG